MENEGGFFDYVLFRQHTAKIGQNYVKDLNYLGRDLKNIVIVDNSEYAFLLQKSNGILIKNFDGNDSDDVALDNLGTILNNIISKGYIDIRKELEIRKDEIYKKITLMERNDIDK